MKKIITAFDYFTNKPLVSLIYDGEVKIYPLYHKGIGTILSDVYSNLDIIRNFIYNNEIICNDAKMHMKAFDLDLNKQYNISCYNPDKIEGLPSFEHTVQLLLQQNRLDIKQEVWMNALGNASVVYEYIERRGYKYYGKVVHPQFYLDTFSGRTRSTGFSIHNKNSDDLITSVDQTKNIFVHFDWISADLRFGAILSEDEEMIEIFKESDPYTFITEELGIERNEVKQLFLQAINNKQFDDPIFEMYPKFAAWLSKQYQLISENKPVYNILNRPYMIQLDRTDKSVLNATMQGSVASAVQIVFDKIYALDKSVLFADIYDSIVCVTSESALNDVIEQIGDIMYRPFKSILNKDITLPYKVSVGTKWAQWQEVMVVR